MLQMLNKSNVGSIASFGSDEATEHARGVVSHVFESITGTYMFRMATNMLCIHNVDFFHVHHGLLSSLFGNNQLVLVNTDEVFEMYEVVHNCSITQVKRIVRQNEFFYHHLQLKDSRMWKYVSSFLINQVSYVVLKGTGDNTLQIMVPANYIAIVPNILCDDCCDNFRPEDRCTVVLKNQSPRNCMIRSRIRGTKMYIVRVDLKDTDEIVHGFDLRKQITRHDLNKLPDDIYLALMNCAATSVLAEIKKLPLLSN